MIGDPPTDPALIRDFETGFRIEENSTADRIHAYLLQMISTDGENKTNYNYVLQGLTQDCFLSARMVLPEINQYD